jgi:hypothetical protein
MQEQTNILMKMMHELQKKHLGSTQSPREVTHNKPHGSKLQSLSQEQQAINTAQHHPIYAHYQHTYTCPSTSTYDVDRMLFLREGLELRALRFVVGDFSRTLSGPEMFFL